MNAKNSEIYLRDPFVILYEGSYYMYGTRSETAFTDEAFGFDVYMGKDLENWEGPFEVFTRPENFWASRHYWAPEVHFYGGKFYMFATFADAKRQGTAILAADDPKGPFLPWSGETVTPKDWLCLDGTFYLSKDKIPYMVFCHEWKQVRDGEICAVRLTKDLKQPVGEPFLLFCASRGEPVIHPYRTKNYVTDGPFLLRTPDGKLHMLWSSFGEDQRYVQALAHSDNDEIDGNWTVDQNLLYESDGGHGMIFWSKEKEPVLTLHSPNKKNMEHPVFIKLVYRTESGWVPERNRIFESRNI